MKLITLDQIEFPKLVDCFNLAFSDYFVKFQVDEAYLRNRWHAANMHYSLSAGVLEDDKLVGFIVIGVGERDGMKTSYNGGTGVIPTHRGRGYTSQMYDFLLPKFKAFGIKCHLLEVIQENVKAIHLYEKAGLKIDRGLNCYSGEITLESNPNENIEIKKVEQLDWKAINDFYDYIPSWDNTRIAIIRNAQDYHFFEAFQNDKLVGFLVVKNADGSLMQFGISPEHRRQKIGSAMIYFIKNQFPKIKINNVDDSQKHVLEFVKHIGLNNTINQYEMVSYLQ